jgi:hypothetical protein
MWFCLPVLLHGQATASQPQTPSSAIQQQTQPLDNELDAGDEDKASPDARAQGQAPAAGATLDSEIEAAVGAEDEPIPPKDQKLDSKLMHWSDYVGKNFTFHFGYNLMYDFVGYKQDPGSVAQFGGLVNPALRWRDIRRVHARRRQQ